MTETECWYAQSSISHNMGMREIFRLRAGEEDSGGDRSQTTGPITKQQDA